MAVEIAPRRFAVATAGFWYQNAEKARAEGKLQDAYLFMVNAFNHTENALYAERYKTGSRDVAEPPAALNGD